jgi:hypothetical protein
VLGNIAGNENGCPSAHLALISARMSICMPSVRIVRLNARSRRCSGRSSST